MPLGTRFFYALVYAVAIVGAYKLVQIFLTDFAPTFYSVKLPGEENIPFLPQMIVLYLSIYVAAPSLLFIIDKKRPFFRVVEMFFAATLIHVVCFVLLPVKYDLRPDLQAIPDSWLLQAVRWTYLMDGRSNCFPSMHVSFAFLTYFCVRAFRPAWSFAFLALASGVALSTLLVKQHYLADVFAAVFLAWVLSRSYLDSNLHAEPAQEGRVPGINDGGENA